MMIDNDDDLKMIVLIIKMLHFFNVLINIAFAFKNTLRLNINDNQILTTNKVKLLGIEIDNALNFTAHRQKFVLQGK